MRTFNQDPEFNLLRQLPQRGPPPQLSAQLEVMASREAQRRRRRTSLRAVLRYWREEAALLVDNLMRPLAVPAAGGVVSALVLFLSIAPSLAVNRVVAADVPLSFATEATLVSSFSFDLSEDEVVIDLVIDEQGRVAGYSLPPGQAWSGNPDIVRNLENTLLCTKFAPATFFGVPQHGKTRITLRRSHVEVRG